MKSRSFAVGMLVWVVCAWGPVKGGPIGIAPHGGKRPVRMAALSSALQDRPAGLARPRALSFEKPAGRLMHAAAAGFLNLIADAPRHMPAWPLPEPAAQFILGGALCLLGTLRYRFSRGR